MFRRSYTLCTRMALAGLLVFTTTAESMGSKRLIPGQPLLLSPQQPGTTTQNAPANAALHIVVLEGEDSVNIVKTKTAVQPVVEVRDRNNLPVAGIWVTFTAPDHGATAVFANGSHSLMVMTNAQGRAVVVGMRPVGTGSFSLSVSASLLGAVATATIAETNYARPESSPNQNSGGAVPVNAASHTRLILLIAGGAAAAAITAGILVSRGGPSATISQSGTPTVTAPH